MSNQTTSSPQRILGSLLILSGIVLGMVTLGRVARTTFASDVQPPPRLARPVLPPTNPLPPLVAHKVQGSMWQAPPVQPTPVGAVKPPPAQPPVGIAIPAIDLAASVIPVSPISTTRRSGAVVWSWATADYAVGHLESSALPGAGGNIVLAGHNNTKGEVFRQLPDLKTGQAIRLDTASGAHYYTVREVRIVKYRRDPVAGEAILQEYMAPTTTERLTLLSCYPYFTNADRIVVVAEPVQSQRRGPY
jgi:sortase A